MLWSPKLSLSNMRVRLTAKGLLRNLQLLSGCRKSPMVFQAVDKTRTKASPSRSQPARPQANGPPEAGLAPSGVEQHRVQSEKKNHSLQQLKRLFISGNRRFEALSLVLQHTLNERDEAVEQHRELALELVTLQGELVTSAQARDGLQRERDELRVSLDDGLRQARAQHRSELAQLEERLRAFYSAEWDKAHQVYQEEADRCKAQMEQQMEDLRSQHKALREELESSHKESLQQLVRQQDKSLAELREAHEEERRALDEALTETEASLSGRVRELAAENGALSERLRAEEESRRALAERSQDSHTLYLEQELESLKVVLDIKNKQLHQYDVKLMQMDKLTEKNVKLTECLQKVQQENEDYRARMDRHAALSRQLSTEQAVLQESLHKESKVNKRLSMENEELLWKLHNGDLSSPRKLSPTSPSRSLQSPRTSAVFSSPPLSPR